MTKIALLDDYQRVALEMADWSRLPADAEITVFDDHVADLDRVAARLQPFEVIAIMRERTPFPRALIERLPNLKFLVTTGMRNASVDLDAAADAGIVVSGTPGRGHGTSEIAWGLALSLLRHIPLEHRAMTEGRWQSTIGVDLYGKTLGVLGLGRLGARVAAVGRAFEMRVIAWSQNLTAERAEECGGELVDKDALFSQSDLLSIHLVLSERTRGLVGPAELARMKPTACLINTSRGPIVDEAALIEALRAQTIGGAGLDVYDVEPLPADHPLRGLDNVVLTPHLGYVTDESYAVFFQGMSEAIKAYLDGAPIAVISPPKA